MVIHNFQKDTSPRLDGWTMEYFLGFYDLIEDDLVRVVEDSFNNGKVFGLSTPLLYP
jgi:hypothetical protein